MATNIQPGGVNHRDIIMHYFSERLPDNQPVNVSVSIPDTRSTNQYQLSFYSNALKNIDKDETSTVEKAQLQAVQNFIYYSLVKGFHSENELQPISISESLEKTPCNSSQLANSYCELGTATDIAIVTEDKRTIRAHKVVLSAVSLTLKVSIEPNPEETSFSLPYVYDRVYPVIKSFYDNDFNFLMIPPDQQMATINICLFLQIEPYLDEIMSDFIKFPLTEKNVDDYIYYLEQFRDKELWAQCIDNIVNFLLDHLDDPSLLQKVLSTSATAYFTNAITLEALLVIADFADEQIIPLVHNIPLTLREIQLVFDRPHFSEHPSVSSFLDLLFNTGRFIYETAANKTQGVFEENYYLLPCEFSNQSQRPNSENPRGSRSATFEFQEPIASIEQLKKLLPNPHIRIIGQRIEGYGTSDFVILNKIDFRPNSVRGQGCFGLLYKDSPWSPKEPKLFAFSMFEHDGRDNKDFFATYLTRNKQKLRSECSVMKNLVTEDEVSAGLRRVDSLDEYPLHGEYSTPAVPPLPERPTFRYIILSNLDGLSIISGNVSPRRGYKPEDSNMLPTWINTERKIPLNTKQLQATRLQVQARSLSLSNPSSELSSIQPLSGLSSPTISVSFIRPIVPTLQFIAPPTLSTTVVPTIITPKEESEEDEEEEKAYRTLRSSFVIPTIGQNSVSSLNLASSGTVVPTLPRIIPTIPFPTQLSASQVPK